MAGPLTTQAQNEAVVRFGPQRFALRELLAQIVSSRDMALHAAAGAERGIQAAIRAARSETQSNYGQAISAGAGTTDLVQQTLAKLGQGATPYAAAFAREGGLGTGRMQQSEANSLQDLTNRRLEAASGRAFQTRHATDVFNTDVGKVQRSYQELAGEQGAFTQGRIGELKKQEADRQFQQDLADMRNNTTIRGQNLSHTDRQAAIQQQRDAAANKPGAGRTVGGGVKVRTPESHQALMDSIESAKIDAAKQKKLGRHRADVIPLITNGRHDQTITDPQTGQKLKVPGIKSHPALAVQVATDLAYDGKISRATLAKLHKLGYSLKELGYPYMDRRGPGRGQGGPNGTGRISG